MRTQSKHFQKKLFIQYSLLLAAIIIVSTTIFAINGYQNLVNQSTKNLEQLVQKTTNELDSLFADMDRITLYIVSNPFIHDTLSEAYFDEITDFQIETEVSKTLTAISVSNQAGRFRINVYNEKGNFITTGLAFTPTIQEALFQSEDYSAWYQNLPIRKNKASISGFSKDYLSLSSSSMISLYREIYSFRSMNRTLGIVEIQCPYSVFEEILSFSDRDFTGYFYDEMGVLLYPAEDSAYGNELYQAYQETNDGILHRRIYTSSVSQKTGHTLLITMPNSQNVNLIKSMLVLPLFFALTAFTLSLGMVYIISRKVTEPLQKLALSVNHVTLSNLSLNVNSDVHMDEIAHLNCAFQEMFHRLEDSMEESSKIKEQNMKAHMIALQSQMDPHFLYNVLSIIKAMARANEGAKIAEASDHLTRMLRYNGAYDKQYVSLQTELEHTEHYLALMKLRYEDMFEYQIEIEHTGHEIQIPKLSIQPLVENCFQHGFKKKAPPWNIYIRLTCEGNRWFLSVEDNGSGITPDAIAHLYKHVDEFLANPSDQLASLKIGGMGLVNTIARFKLTYKEHLTFTIMSLPQGGTKITIGGIDTHEDFIG